MKIEAFLASLEQLKADFFTGVPDSQLRPLCDYLMTQYGVDPLRHIVAADEGAAVGLAAGHYLATRRPAVVYMQNSGLGNAVNPICSLLHPKVYGIPAVFVVGWRGEPGVHDEPQHVFQGEITLKLLECLEIETFVIGTDTSEEALMAFVEKGKAVIAEGRSIAFVVRKNALETSQKASYHNPWPMCREKIVETILDYVRGDDVIVSTTGKLSRELFELREKKGQPHSKDFLVVGSMGHSSMIASQIAGEKPERRVFCLDGDGAVLMHMGSMATVGSLKHENFYHILINNQAHETVGGIPTVSSEISWQTIAKGCGYAEVFSAKDPEELNSALKAMLEKKGPCFLEVKSNLISRKDLGRPTIPARENKEHFMEFLEGETE